MIPKDWTQKGRLFLCFRIILNDMVTKVNLLIITIHISFKIITNNMLLKTKNIKMH